MALRILVVDDNNAFREVARRVLRSDGLEVVGTAATCAEAVALVRSLRPDVVLLDVHLGAESGFDVARRLAIARAAPGPGVVLMSTGAKEDFEDEIARSPVAGFVAKERLSGGAIRRLLDPGEG